MDVIYKNLSHTVTHYAAWPTFTNENHFEMNMS